MCSGSSVVSSPGFVECANRAVQKGRRRGQRVRKQHGARSSMHSRGLRHHACSLRVAAWHPSAVGHRSCRLRIFLAVPIVRQPTGLIAPRAARHAHGMTRLRTRRRTAAVAHRTAEGEDASAGDGEEEGVRENIIPKPNTRESRAALMCTSLISVHPLQIFNTVQRGVGSTGGGAAGGRRPWAGSTVGVCVRVGGVGASERSTRPIST